LAIELINTQPSSSFEDLLIAEIGVPAELVSKIELPTFTKAQLPQEKDLQKVEQWLNEKELVTADFDISTVIAATLLP
ncbi:MAG: ABC transporter substrate-binding protein, partial [Bacteroidales bacterium]|nr:ABC transporter substrate-binding protein [Bacteroidales bacterium]